MALAMKATVTTMSSMPWRFSSSTMCSIIGRLTSGQHRLGGVRRQGPQAGALASCHDHGLHAPEPTRRVRVHTARGVPASGGGRAERPGGAALAQGPQRRWARRGRPRSSSGRRPGIPPARPSAVESRRARQVLWTRPGSSGKANIRRRCRPCRTRSRRCAGRPEHGQGHHRHRHEDLAGDDRQPNHAGAGAADQMMPPTPTKNSRRSATGSSTLPRSDTWWKWRAT